MPRWTSSRLCARALRSAAYAAALALHGRQRAGARRSISRCFSLSTAAIGHPTLSGVVGYACGIVLHYQLSRRFVFATAASQKSAHRRFVEFVASGLIGLAVTAAVIAAGDRHGREPDSRQGDGGRRELHRRVRDPPHHRVRLSPPFRNTRSAGILGLRYCPRCAPRTTHDRLLLAVQDRARGLLLGHAQGARQEGRGRGTACATSRPATTCAR